MIDFQLAEGQRLTAIGASFAVGFPDCASFKIIQLLLSHLLFPAFD
jgi:hypothetical protein